MSVASKKITIYSSPQLFTPSLASHQVDCNQNAKPMQVLKSNPSEELNQTLSPSPMNGIAVPQRTTLRLRISNPKELELLQSAASRGCATFGGRQVRIVSVQPSTVPAEVNISNSVSGLLDIQPSGINPRNFSTASSQVQTHGIPTSTLTSSQSFSSQVTSRAQSPLCSSTGGLAGGVGCSSVGGALRANFVSSLAEMINPCDKKYDALQSESAQSVGNFKLSETGLSSTRSVLTDIVSAAVITHSSKNSQAQTLTECRTDTAKLSYHNSTSFISSDAVAKASFVAGGLLDMESQPISHHSSVTIRTMASQGAKYLGTFAVNSDSSNGVSEDKNVRSTDNSQRVVLRISSKNNLVDVKSLMSAERLPVLVKAIEKVLSDKGIKSSAASIMHQVGVLQAGNNHGSVASRLEKFVPLNKNTNKRPGTFNDVKYPAKKSSHSIGRTEQNCISLSQPNYYPSKNCVSKINSKTVGSPNGLNHSQVKGGRGTTFDGCSTILSYNQVLPSHDQKCARHRPFITRKKRGTFSFLMSYYRRKVITHEFQKSSQERSMLTCVMPVAARFRHLRTSVHRTVGVYRSGIHGLGLFARRKIDESEMIVEYAGEVIRASVADVRERHYESLGIGCYMFRHGEDDVVDATKCGNVARFINHSCEPNCYSREILIEGRRHIVIFALRCVHRGEELTYDYKFPIEDVKMLCMCNARRCRKYLN